MGELSAYKFIKEVALLEGRLLSIQLEQLKSIQNVLIGWKIPKMVHFKV